MIVPPLPSVPRTATESPGRTESRLTLRDSGHQGAPPPPRAPPPLAPRASASPDEPPSVPLVPLVVVLVVLEPSEGSVWLTKSSSPALRPLTITERLVPRRPTTTWRSTRLPS